jgi:hypothetical protein
MYLFISIISWLFWLFADSIDDFKINPFLNFVSLSFNLSLQYDANDIDEKEEN